MEKKFVFNVDETSEIVAKALANVYYEKHKEDASFSIPADSLKVAVEAANLGGMMMEKKIAEKAVKAGAILVEALCTCLIEVGDRTVNYVNEGDYIILYDNKNQFEDIKNTTELGVLKLATKDPLMIDKMLNNPENRIVDMREYPEFSVHYYRLQWKKPKKKLKNIFAAKWYEYS